MPLGFDRLRSAGLPARPRSFPAGDMGVYCSGEIALLDRGESRFRLRRAGARARIPLRLILPRRVGREDAAGLEVFVRAELRERLQHEQLAGRARRDDLVSPPLMGYLVRQDEL